ncbi:hypothetical protein ACRS64_26995 [Pseudomonas aeruginosa]|uniref:hypothetical protein n=1 Tax=Pseudomonas aeruginosa TaxID=287 RepID=UPI003DA74B58
MPAPSGASSLQQHAHAWSAERLLHARPTAAGATLPTLGRERGLDRRGDQAPRPVLGGTAGVAAANGRPGLLRDQGRPHRRRRNSAA